MEERKLKAKKEEIINVLLPYDEHKGKTFNSLNSKTKPVLLGLLKQEDYDNLKLLEKSTSNKGKGARQKHGFKYEDVIRERYGLTKCKYGDNWDALEKVGDKIMNVSIKSLEKGNEICLSDFFGRRKIDADFFIYVGIYRTDVVENKETKIIEKIKTFIEEFKVLIKVDNWKTYFGNYIDEEALKLDLSKISKDKKDDDKWVDFQKKWGDIYGKDAVIRLRPKRSEKKENGDKGNKRIQCAISMTSFRDIIIKQNRVCNTY